VPESNISNDIFGYHDILGREKTGETQRDHWRARSTM